jgi:hypothetical protein
LLHCVRSTLCALRHRRASQDSITGIIHTTPVSQIAHFNKHEPNCLPLTAITKKDHISQTVRRFDQSYTYFLTRSSYCIDRPNLSVNDLGPELDEACRRFARCFFSHEGPTVNSSRSPERLERRISKVKMNCLRYSPDPFKPDASVAQRMIRLVKGMKWTEAECLESADDGQSWSLPRI